MYRSPNTAREIKSIKLRLAGHVARIEGGSAFKILTGKLTGKRLELGVNGRTILKCTSKKYI